MVKIKYNKNKPGRILAGGGPRDVQLRQRLMQAELIKRAVDNTNDVVNNKDVKPKEPAVDLSQYLPLNTVKEKIDAAVEFTKKNERETHEITNQKIVEKDLVIDKLASELAIKEEIYTNLQLKMDKIYERVNDESIQPIVDKKRPDFGDKIFIDPLEKDAEPRLDPHINIKEDKSSKETSERDINTDLAKLRGLLKP